MRALLVLALLGGCAAGSSSRPAVIPMLSELPGDPQKRDAVLDSAVAQPGPEQRKPLPPKLHKAETAAATAAAIIGGLFSKTQNVTLGAASLVDENQLFVPSAAPAARRATSGTEGEGGERREKREGGEKRDGDEAAASPVPEERPADLVPWVKLK